MSNLNGRPRCLEFFTCGRFLWLKSGKSGWLLHKRGHPMYMHCVVGVLKSFFDTDFMAFYTQQSHNGVTFKWLFNRITSLIQQKDVFLQGNSLVLHHERPWYHVRGKDKKSCLVQVSSRHEQILLESEQIIFNYLRWWVLEFEVPSTLVHSELPVHLRRSR